VDNTVNLAPAFLAEMQRRYADTLLGRQELEGEIVEERMTGLWKRSWLDQGRLAARPELKRIVVAVDPPVSSNAGSDSCGIIIAGLGVDDRGYVIGDRTIQGREPAVWAHAAVAAYRDYSADRIVVETNQGGDLVVQVFRTIEPNLPVKKVPVKS
jgi:phage terminase large subunit-like protein